MNRQTHTKQDIISEIHSFGNCFVVSLGAAHLLCRSDAPKRLKDAVLSVEGATFNLTPLSESLRGEPSSRPSVQGFLKSSYRTCLCETFEVLNKYCVDTKQEKLFRSQNWYDFVRIVRNALRHNFTFAFRPSDVKKLPVSWKGKQITTAMEGTLITFSFLGFDDLRELYSALEAFARKLA